ncbi:hypothetical protein CORC01_05819 [Colletotrichum orchidophilum]|uniref:Uncharacterized protein n=1 Tax=Colletotrichum orchidophilum TaxID=1209926 RepID=A0A1G4BC21_9PEZI|nr:uncharacterized protein CORC01_05819 [Colletotrichum orchidophilum]OHE98923.1 hypothetical protein CORC01_05819 [Colletotrichum orchidophilum]
MVDFPPSETTALGGVAAAFDVPPHWPEPPGLATCPPLPPLSCGVSPPTELTAKEPKVRIEVGTSLFPGGSGPWIGSGREKGGNGAIERGAADSA